jgi:hypothetical protein
MEQEQGPIAIRMKQWQIVHVGAAVLAMSDSPSLFEWNSDQDHRPGVAARNSAIATSKKSWIW